MRRVGGMGAAAEDIRRKSVPTARRYSSVSKETGGTYVEVSRKQTIDSINSRIEEELRNQYSLGRTSDQPAPQTGYPAISLTVGKKNLTAQNARRVLSGTGPWGSPIAAKVGEPRCATVGVAWRSSCLA